MSDGFLLMEEELCSTEDCIEVWIYCFVVNSRSDGFLGKEARITYSCKKHMSNTVMKVAEREEEKMWL